MHRVGLASVGPVIGQEQEQDKGWLRHSALLGSLVWGLVVCVSALRATTPGLITLLLVLAVLVCTPLALSLASTSRRAGDHPRALGIARTVQPLAGLLVVLSLALPRGPAAAVAALPWVLCAVCAALEGFTRLGRLVHLGHRVRRSRMPVADAYTSAGLVLFSLGSLWLLLWRAGLRPGGLDDTIVLLVAVHFHYAGFYAPVLAGCTGRYLAQSQRLMQPHPLARRAFPPVAGGVVAGPVLLALAFAIAPPLEMPAVALLAASLVALALLTLFAIVPTLAAPLARTLLAVSATAVIFSMLLACLFALAATHGTPEPTLPAMVRLHGTANALGFVLCGLLGWTRLHRRSPAVTCFTARRPLSVVKWCRTVQEDEP